MLRAIFPPRVATQCETCRFWQPDDEQDEVVLGWVCQREQTSPSRPNVPELATTARCTRARLSPT